MILSVIDLNDLGSYLRAALRKYQLDLEIAKKSNFSGQSARSVLCVVCVLAWSIRTVRETD